MNIVNKHQGLKFSEWIDRHHDIQIQVPTAPWTIQQA